MRPGVEAVDVPRDPATLPPGLVAVTADEAGRFTTFAASMQQLWMPAGTGTAWQIGNDVPGNRNEACAALLDDPELRWLWFIDDDHHFAYDLLARLLLDELPIVGPLCLRRTQPFMPTACRMDGGHMHLNGDVEPDSVIEVLHTGSSGLLVQRDVIEKINPPWFALEWEHDLAGNPSTVSEDVMFCRKARDAGFPVHVDTGCPLGHITTAVIWPTFHQKGDHGDLGWMTGLTVANGAQIYIEPGSTEPGS